MSVLVDQEPLQAEALGLQTVGQVLSHLQRDNKLVVHVLVDGQVPDLEQMGTLRKSPLSGHTLFIETADPRQLAADALSAVQEQMIEAERLRAETVDLLQKNQNVRAMEKLSGCFSTWQSAQESVLKTARLLRIDLNQICVDDELFTDLLAEFIDQLRQVKTALENRDFVLMTDVLSYEITQTSARWVSALRVLRKVIGCN